MPTRPSPVRYEIRWMKLTEAVVLIACVLGVGAAAAGLF